MAVPKYHEFFPSFMESLSDGNIHTIREVRKFCAKAFQLSEDDLQETLPSGQNVFGDRVGWARTYLKKAGLIESPVRAQYRLSNEGKKALAKGADKIDLQFLLQYESFADFVGRPVSGAKNGPDGSVREQSPHEMISSALSALNASLADDLMVEVQKLSPFDFEGLVIKLLMKMGYGSSLQFEDGLTKKAGDEGIDGIITSDKFGFDAIYTQAKKWNQDSVVGRPEIQRFLGALAGQGATKGLFFTTAKFSKEAIAFAEKQLHSKIVLIDGEALMKLMIEYNLGVSTVATYSIKRVDYDFFNEET